MKKICLLALASLFVLSASRSTAVTTTENFSSNPLQNGWQTFGNANQFNWNSVNQNLEVTWDSSKTNSYFYHPLGTTVSRYDDFHVEFDLLLKDIISGNEPNKTGPLEIAIGFFNTAIVTNPAFGRGIYGGAPNIAEFDYFPPGYYDFGGVFPVNASTTPTFISSSGFGYAPTTFSSYEFQLPTNQIVHISMTYTATNQTLATILSTNGTTMFQPSNVVLNGSGSGFTSTDDFRVDAFSISSYSSFGDDYDSVLAHGTVDSIVVNVPPPIQNLTGTFSGNMWQGQFGSRTNWNYVLERSTNFSQWNETSATASGNGGQLSLTDTNAATSSFYFYRVKAQRPN